MKILTYFSRITTTTTNKFFETFWSVTFAEIKWSKGHGHSLVHCMCSKWTLTTSEWHNYHRKLESEPEFRLCGMNLCSSDNHYILEPHVSSSIEIVHLVLREESSFNIIDFDSCAFPGVTQTLMIRETKVWNINYRVNSKHTISKHFSVLKTFFIPILISVFWWFTYFFFDIDEIVLGSEAKE